MIQPFDYRVNVAQPMAGALTGIQSAMQISREMDAGDAEAQRAALYRAQTEKAQQDVAAQKAKDAQAAALRAEVEQVAKAPTSASISALMVKYPHLSEGFNRALGAVSSEEQKARILEGTQAYAAILNGDVDTAKTVLSDTAAALREKGNAPQAAAYERMVQLIGANPAGAQTTIGMMLATAMGPDKFQATFKELEDQRRTKAGEPVAARAAAAAASKAESDAAVAAAKAKYAESDAALDLQKKGWDITKIQEDIKIAKLNAQIAAANVAASREGNALKREELGLKIVQMKSDRDKATNERAAEAMGAFTTVNETDSLLTDILAKDNRSTLESALGASGWMGWVPGTDARTVTGKIERLSNILASANLDQLKGAMSDKDIMFLKNIGANLDRFQDEKKAIAELERVQRTLSTARSKLVQKYGQPPASGASTGNTSGEW